MNEWADKHDDTSGTTSCLHVYLSKRKLLWRSDSDGAAMPFNAHTNAFEDFNDAVYLFVRYCDLMSAKKGA